MVDRETGNGMDARTPGGKGLPSFFLLAGAERRHDADARHRDLPACPCDRCWSWRPSPGRSSGFEEGHALGAVIAYGGGQHALGHARERPPRRPHRSGGKPARFDRQSAASATASRNSASFTWPKRPEMPRSAVPSRADSTSFSASGWPYAPRMRRKPSAAVRGASLSSSSMCPRRRRAARLRAGRRNQTRLGGCRHRPFGRAPRMGA